MPSLGKRGIDDYRKIPMVSLGDKESMKKPTQHFFRFGLRMDQSKDTHLTKNIQTRIFKNLIEAIVDGKRVKEPELYVLAHFLSQRQGRLFAARYVNLKFIYKITKKSTTNDVAKRIFRETQHNGIQHFVLRPDHHTKGHPLGGALARSKTYKRMVGGRLSMHDIGESARKFGRGYGRAVATAGGVGLAMAPGVMVVAPEVAPAWVGVSGAMLASGVLLNKGLRKNASVDDIQKMATI